MEAVAGPLCRACRHCLRKPALRYAFGTSSRLSSIPPESPDFIDVPSSLQADYARPRRPKGILPVPRELFPHQRPDKPSSKYIANATPDPHPDNVVDPSTLTDMGQYKLRMATLRKKHLREGLTELYKRKENMDRRIQERSKAKQSERSRLLAQAEREDVRLTNVSTPRAMLGRTNAHLADYDEERRIYETKKANVERREMEKKEERRDKLHTLYMNARNFITTEDQLVEAIEREFTHKQFGETGTGQSMWDGGAAPDSVKKMLDRAQGATSSSGVRLAADLNDWYSRDQERMQKIAEKLSGGKM